MLRYSRQVGQLNLTDGDLWTVVYTHDHRTLHSANNERFQL